LARDLVEISLEIITEKFSPVTMIEMSQTQLPTREMQEKEIQQIQQRVQSQAQQVAANPQMMQQAQANPQAAQQMIAQAMSQAQSEIQKVTERPSIEQVLKFLKSTRAKSFVLDIETDSTIQPDEQAEKQSRTEFIGMLGQLLPQLSQMITAEPQTAEFCGELLKFATAPFRAGRSLDGAIDELVEQMKSRSGQPRPDPETEKLKMLQQVEQDKLKVETDKNKTDAELEAAKLKQADQHKKLELQNDRALKTMELNAKAGDSQAKAQVQNQKAMHDREKHQLDMVKSQQEMEADRQKMDLAVQQSSLKSADMQNRQAEREALAQFKMNQPIGGGRPP
jgi:hypothetical protein